MLLRLGPRSCGGFPMWMLGTRFPGSPTPKYGIIQMELAEASVVVFLVNKTSDAMLFRQWQSVLLTPIIPIRDVYIQWKAAYHPKTASQTCVGVAMVQVFFKNVDFIRQWNKLSWAYPFLIVTNTDYIHKTDCPYPQTVSISVASQV